MRFGSKVWASLSLRKGRPTSTRLAAAVSLDTNGSLRAPAKVCTGDPITCACPDIAVAFTASRGTFLTSTGRSGASAPPFQDSDPGTNEKRHERSAHRDHGLRAGRLRTCQGLVQRRPFGG